MNRATETEQGLPADAQVLLEVVHQVILLAEGEQGDVGGVPHGHQRDDLAETQPQEVHGDPGRAPQPGQDGGRGEGRDIAPQVNQLPGWPVTWVGAFIQYFEILRPEIKPFAMIRTSSYPSNGHMYMHIVQRCWS